MSIGQTHSTINQLLIKGGKNDPTTISYIRTKLMLKGIDPDKWGSETEDNPQILAIVEKFASRLIGT